MTFFKTLFALILSDSMEAVQESTAKRVNNIIENEQRKADKAFEKVQKLEAAKAKSDEQVKRGEVYKKNLAKMFTDE